MIANSSPSVALRNIAKRRNRGSTPKGGGGKISSKKMKQLIEKLSSKQRLEVDKLNQLIATCCHDDNLFNHLRNKATQIAQKQFGFGIYTRGLIEISSNCRNNCFYCGLRRDNRNATRYRLTDDEILACCIDGYQAGLRSFVLQGGEDLAFSDKRLVDLITQIKRHCLEAAITLSLGERSAESYQLLYNAGASRYLLRHEAANASLYSQIHPSEMSHENRINCIKSLIAIGYQTGMGMMVGVPEQTISHLVDDLQLMSQMQPQMIGIGAFIPHPNTPLGTHSAGDLRLTLTIIAIARLMHPDALIPATTALATLTPDGYLQGILSGANVVMPNITPQAVRSHYDIYPGKEHSQPTITSTLNNLSQQLATIGYHFNPTRGDHKAN